MSILNWALKYPALAVALRASTVKHCVVLCSLHSTSCIREEKSPGATLDT